MELATKGTTTKPTETENLFEVLCNNSPVGVCIIQDGKFCYVNTTFCRNTGYREDELLGRDSLAIVFPEDRKAVRENVIKMLKGKLTQPYQFRVVHKDGSIHWVIESVASIQHLGKRATLASFVDITDRKRAEEALQAEKNKLQSLIDAMADSIVMQDREYNILYQNDISKKVFGDHVGEKCYKVFEGQKKMCDGCPVEKAFKDGKPHTSERKTVLPSGEIIIWENTANPVRDADGKIVACLEIGRDITEHKRMEEAQQQSEKKYRALFDSALTGTVVIDAETMKLTMANQAAANMFGFSSAEEAIGINPLDLISPEYRERAFEIIANIADISEQELCRAEEFRMMTKDGREIWILAVGARILHEGRLAMLFSFTDITEHKRQEQALSDELTRRRILVDQSLDGIVVLDEDARVVEANQRFAEMLGYTPEEVLKLHTWDWDKNFPPEKILEMGRAVDEKGFHLETKHTRKDSSVFDVDISINAAMFGGKKLIFCVCRDITARKQAEEALQAEKNKLQALIDAMSDALNIIDTDYTILYQNEPSKRAIGGDHTGEKCYRVFEGREKVCEGCPVREAFKDGKSHTSERMTIISGEVSFWENTANPIRDTSGKVVACLEIARNITERKKAEEALNLQRAYFQQLFDSSPDAIAMIDMNDRVIQVNKGFEMLFGYSAEEVKGQPISKLVIPEEDVEVALASLHRVLSGEIVRRESARRRKDGSLVDVSILGYPIRFNGGLAGAYIIYTDITKRKEAEEALKLAAQEWQKTFDSIADAVCINDKHFRIQRVNKAFADMYHVEPSQVIGKHCYEVTGDRERPIEGCPQLETLRTGKPAKSEFFVHEKGIYVEISTSPIFDSQGEVIGTVHVTRNITEHKRREQALADELTRRRILVDQSLDGIVVLDEDARVVEANQRFAEMLGYTPEEVLKLHTWDWDKNFPPEKILEMGRAVDEKGFHLETKHTRKDGSVFDVDISINAAMFGGQKLIFCVCRDITARKKMEEALKLAAEEWKRTFDSISDGISIHDRDFRILQVNQAFADLFQKSPSQIVGKHCYELHHGEKPHAGCPHQETLATGKPASAEFYESHLKKFLRESTSPIFNEKGEIVGSVHITRDITEQKRQSERLMMADRLASLGELAAGTAHELNNPLTSILGFSQLLMEKDIPDNIREDVKLIHDEAQRAADVTKNLLTFARKHTSVKQLTQINNIIEDVLKLRAYEQKVNSIVVKKQLDPNLPEIMVDNFQMQQVFLNIIINAEYFMTEAHKKGTLTVTTKKQNGTVMISFADDGPGIPPENLERIFDPFFTTKEPGKGTGLGLSICHGIVTEHGGQIYAQSQLGKGATIIIELPIKKP